MFNGYKFNQTKFNSEGVTAINASLSVTVLNILTRLTNSLVIITTPPPRVNRFRFMKHNDSIEVTKHNL